MYIFPLHNTFRPEWFDLFYLYSCSWWQLMFFHLGFKGMNLMINLCLATIHLRIRYIPGIQFLGNRSLGQLNDWCSCASGDDEKKIHISVFTQNRGHSISNSEGGQRQRCERFWPPLIFIAVNRNSLCGLLDLLKDRVQMAYLSLKEHFNASLTRSEMLSFRNTAKCHWPFFTEVWWSEIKWRWEWHSCQICGEGNWESQREHFVPNGPKSPDFMHIWLQAQQWDI